MPREFRPNVRNIKGFLKDERVASLVNTAGNAVAKQAVGMVGSINGQPAPYLVYRPAPFVRGGSQTGNQIGPPRFYRTSRTGKRRHYAHVTYSHPTPKGRMAMRQALMAAAHANLRDVVDGEVVAARKAEKKWKRKNKRDAKLTLEQLQARADKRAARARRKPRRKVKR